MLMDKGVEQLQRPASLPEALETFEQAVKLDPMFAESWNKVATVMFLQRRCAPRPSADCTEPGCETSSGTSR
jgi:hypothetical protein